MKRCTAGRSRFGHTLLEMLLSLVLLSIVMASVGSAVMFASQAVPDDTSPAGSLLADTQVLSRVAEDLALAQFILEQTDHAVTVVVADRTGDSIPDRIRYAWSGASGAPLYFQLNDEAAVILVQEMAVFDLAYMEAAVTQSLPTASYLGDETMVAVYDSEPAGADVGVQNQQWYGQIIEPELSDDAIGFVPTKIDLFVGNDGGSDGRTLIAIREENDDEPGEQTYASLLLDESSVPDETSWVTLELDTATAVPVDEPVLLTATYEQGTDIVLDIGTVESDGLLSSSDGGQTWEEVDDAQMLYRLYGRERLMQDTAYDVTRQHVTRIDLSMQRVAEDRSPLNRTVVLTQAPPVLTGFAATGFDVDPTSMDLNADGVTDWSHSDGMFPADSLSNGLWNGDGLLTYDHKSMESAAVIRVRTRMASTGVLGPTVYGPYIINERDELLPIITRLRSDGNGGQELVIYNDLTEKAERLVLTGLPSGLLDVGLTLVPGQDLVSVEINHEPVASVVLDRIADPGPVQPGVSFGSGGGVVSFGSASVIVGGSVTSRPAESGLLELNIGGIGITVF